MLGSPGRVALGQVEGSLVVGADGGVEQSPVAQAHSRARDRAWPSRLQRAAGIDQRGGVSVSQLVRGHVVEAGAGGGAVELVAQPG